MAEMGKSPIPTDSGIKTPVTPPDNTQGADGQKVPNNSLNFNSSEIGTKTARKEDVFAEHKRKDAEKKAKLKMTRKRLLIFGAIGVVIVVAVVMFIMTLIGKDEPIDGSDPKVIENNQELFQKIVDEANSKASDSDGDSEEDDSAVVESYQNAIDTAKNRNDANVAKVALMQHYTNEGDNQKALEVSGGVEDIDDMDLYTRLVYYDAMAQLYYEIGQYNKSEYYYELASNLSNDYERFLFGDNEVEEL